MGEYAERKSDRKEIKIGTCENMYYLRYSDRDKVRPLENNLDPSDEETINELRWRLPFPDEDNTQPGDYGDAFRGAKLYNFTNPETTGDPGIVQLSSQTGLLVNITCYHGEKLPENTKDVKFFWNGKDSSYELRHLKFINGVPFGVYTCIECRQSWRIPLKEIIPFMVRYEDQPLKNRLIEWYVPELKRARGDNEVLA